MKPMKLILIILAVVIIITAAIILFSLFRKYGTDGTLYYEISKDKTYYSVSGLKDKDATDITIPTTFKDLPVKKIGSSAFSQCSTLKSVKISEGVSFIDNESFAHCTSLTNISIPDSMKEVVSSAFNGCTSLKYNTLDNSGDYLGNDSNPYVILMGYVYEDVDNINDNTKVIYASAFSNRSALTKITIPDGVTSIGNSAFEYCNNLEKISIGNSVSLMGNNAFYGCNNLEYNIHKKSGRYLGNAQNPYLVLMYLPEKYDESGAKITEYSTPMSTKIIYDKAFNSSCLEKVTLSDTVVSMGERVFSSKLTSVVLGKNITNIGWGAFSHCTALTQITIPASVTKIEYQAFWGCVALTKINYEGTKEQWELIDISAGALPRNDHGGELCDFTIYCTDDNIEYKNGSKRSKFFFM